MTRRIIDKVQDLYIGSYERGKYLGKELYDAKQKTEVNTISLAV